MSAQSEPAWVGDVLRFWFDELGRKAWFVRDAAVDEQICARFLPLIEELATRPVDEALASADRALATVIALDQFPRNVFRGTARAFATDALALAVAKAAIARGLDSRCPPTGACSSTCRSSTAKQLADQERCVELTAALGDEEYARYAVLHRDVIARFGRFPAPQRRARPHPDARGADVPQRARQLVLRPAASHKKGAARRLLRFGE